MRGFTAFRRYRIGRDAKRIWGVRIYCVFVILGRVFNVVDFRTGRHQSWVEKRVRDTTSVTQSCECLSRVLALRARAGNWLNINICRAY